MPHDRKLVLGGVSLTLAKIRPASANSAAASRVRDDLEREMVASGYLEGAPFKWVSLIVRYGLVDEPEPSYGAINQKHGDLPLAIEVDVQNLLGVSEDDMALVYRRATLAALIHAGEKYGLKTDALRALLSPS
ncbi:hypothetical protein EAO27_05895 [Sphingopyxis sp. YF1]|uniref:Imm39 family immunity protein n=1 Tax=Sphingopyxis sp. YF1 TaxID=2482763 RepID=UPI001F60044F|nr:Imm39 family immunity protein [Sphingopyxis sp. YF1]UNU42291.1 hypothetical protein EAO27_05895 [Sphingopyxis sp. YF1]